MTQPQKDWRALLRTPRAVDVDGVWSGIEARRARRRSVRRAVWVLPLTAAAAAVMLWWVRASPAGLERQDGGSLAQLTAAAEPAEFVLSDGSRIELAPGTQLETRALTGELFATAVSAGKVTFDVVPHGPRVWRVEAGTTQVRVLGTRFSVERGPAGVQVSVARGRVLVTGPDVAAGSQELRAGQSLRTQPTRPLSSRSSGSDVVGAGPQPPAAESEHDASEHPQAEPAAPASPEDKALAPERSQVGARARQMAEPGVAAADAQLSAAELRGPADLGSAGNVTRTDTKPAGRIERSLREADSARAAGQPERAAKLLARLIAEHPKDARAALAAFTLGELYLGPLHSPLAAAKTFERAQQLGLPSALAEQGAARLFEAYEAAGQRDAAASAARLYLSSYPNGTHRRAAERCVSAP